ncbi:hypothetical protein RBB78_06250 [Tunturiibacter empetritectus]
MKEADSGDSGCACLKAFGRVLDGDSAEREDRDGGSGDAGSA